MSTRGIAVGGKITGTKTLVPDGGIADFAIVVAREGPRKIRSITVIEKGVKVYDLTVSPHPNFFASGVLVHNKLRKK